MKEENNSSRLENDHSPQTIAYSPVEPNYPYSQLPNQNQLIYGQPVPGLNQNISYPVPYPIQYSSAAMQPIQPVVDVQQITVVAVEGIILTDKEKKLLKFAKISRIACIVNLIIDLIMLLSTPGVGILLIGNIFGIFSTNRFNKCLAITYLVYLYLLIIAKLLLIGFVPILTVIIVFPVLIIMNAVVSGIFIVFVRRMYKSKPIELDRCKRYYIGTKRCKCCY